MIPISGIVNASLISSASDPPLSSDSILIKWRPVTAAAAAAGIGSWDNGGGNHTIIMTPGGGGVLVSWLVSLLSEEIKGFILQGLSLSLLLSFLPSPPPPLPCVCLVQIPSPQPLASTSSSTPPPILVLASRCPSLPTTSPSRLAPVANMFLECRTSASMSSAQDCSGGERGEEEQAGGRSKK
jgi:hypothetical protein